MRLWAHERTLGVSRNAGGLQSVEFADIVGAFTEDRHLTKCTHRCYVGAEEDQSEPHDQGRIDDILGDQDMNELPDANTATDEETELL